MEARVRLADRDDDVRGRVVAPLLGPALVDDVEVDAELVFELPHKGRRLEGPVELVAAADEDRARHRVAATPVPGLEPLLGKHGQPVGLLRVGDGGDGGARRREVLALVLREHVEPRAHQAVDVELACVEFNRWFGGS